MPNIIAEETRNPNAMAWENYFHIPTPQVTVDRSGGVAVSFVGITDGSVMRAFIVSRLSDLEGVDVLDIRWGDNELFLLLQEPLE